MSIIYITFAAYKTKVSGHTQHNYSIGQNCAPPGAGRCHTVLDVPRLWLWAHRKSACRGNELVMDVAVLSLWHIGKDVKWLEMKKVFKKRKKIKEKNIEIKEN